MSRVPNARGRLRDAIKKFQRERMNAKEMIPLKSKSGGAINKKGKTVPACPVPARRF